MEAYLDHKETLEKYTSGTVTVCVAVKIAYKIGGRSCGVFKHS